MELMAIHSPDLQIRVRRCRQFWICARSTCILAAFSCIGLLLPARASDDSSRISKNPTFNDGMTGWQASGAVKIKTSAVKPDQHEVVLGPGQAWISQRIAADATNHMTVSAILHSVRPGVGIVTVRFLDKDNHELMSLQSPTDIGAGKKPDTMEDYFRPHPLTASVEIIVSKRDSRDQVTVEQAELDVFKDNDPALKSTQNISELMRPFWKGGFVSNEAVLLTSRNDGPAMGTLMFLPTRIVSVASYDGAVKYQEGDDYSVEGRTLLAGAHSRMSQVHSKDLLSGELAWNVIGGKQVLVTYEHGDAWTGPVQSYVGNQLPNTQARLRDHHPVRIVIYGDSISYGLGSSHMQKISPWQPPWVDLFIDELKKAWQDPGITLFNASQSGADSNWAKRMAGRMVASLHPDLTVIAFGQNDFWSVSPEAFAANISDVMRTVRDANPQAEFLLLSTMRFDPAYTADPTYWNHVSGYQAQLRALTAQGVQLVDITAISGAVFAAKAPRDCINDPLHPNDYLSRWYAQSMVAALVPELKDAEK